MRPLRIVPFGPFGPFGPLGLLSLLLACDAPVTDDGDGDGDRDGQPQGPCQAVTTTLAEESGVHVAQGTPLSFRSNPPATGAHYPVWAPWAQVYDQPVPRGNWIHNLEHGGVALLYRCDGACPQVVSGLVQIGQGLRDVRCASPINARWLVSPDPLLPEGITVAAAAWNRTYRATCLDPQTLSAFVNAVYARGPEDTCADGAITWAQ